MAASGQDAIDAISASCSLTTTMDAKLKALKVVDLKAVLAKAQVQAPAKATKADLIARIVESQAALDAYAELYEEDASEPVVEAPETIPTSDTVEIITETTEDAVPPAEPAAPVDPELEARRKRAERFGIPLVEPKTKQARKERQPKAASSTEVST
jgi:SAP domain-containing ribonucleoprotein